MICLPLDPHPTPLLEGGLPGRASPAQEEPQLFAPWAGQDPGLPLPGAEGSAPEDEEETDGD